MYLLVDQIEFADTIIINKTDMVDAEQLALVRKVIQALNRSARVIETTQAAVDLDEGLIRQRLENCLIDCDRMEPERWAGLRDPFPVWEMQHDD